MSNTNQCANSIRNGGCCGKCHGDEVEVWYDKDGNVGTDGCFDAGGHYYHERSVEIETKE